MCRMSLVTFMNSGCLSASPELFQQSKSLSIIRFAPGLIGHCCLKHTRRIIMHTLPICYALHKERNSRAGQCPLFFYWSLPYNSYFLTRGKTTGFVNIKLTLEFCIFFQLLFIFLKFWWVISLLHTAYQHLSCHSNLFFNRHPLLSFCLPHTGAEEGSPLCFIGQRMKSQT